ncbi:acyl-CoA N-acyltransferase [Apodospora peruviana]|uniref:histone acetyltransferase n=1 Tax=Apodospora peruviana TaxID=516989 RepID=A0AAE0IAW7_9PEZI|nr:acyl-CoA N-acyltransferase [Apodospora peruviana]
MAPLKRKQPPESTATVGAPPAQRRATRQTSIAPLPVLPDPEPRRCRRRGNTNEQLAAETRPSRVSRGKENIPMPLQPEQPRLSKLTRLTRHRGPEPTNRGIAATQPSGPVNGTPKSTPKLHSPVSITTAATAAQPPTQLVGTGAGTLSKHGRSDLQLMVQVRTVGHSKPITMATSTTQPKPTGPVVTSGGSSGQAERGPGQQPDRNIDKVVLGNICFRAWYPSYYGKEVLGDAPGNTTKGEKGAKGGPVTIDGADSSNGEGVGAKTQARKDRDSTPMLDRLFVCPCCFKYSSELVAWWEHVQVCERRGFMPGSKIYVHPKGRRTILVPSAPASKPGRGKRASAGPKLVEKLVQDEGEWSIWEVDGEKDVLFCQNLSLFAKLFLDNKSVFFDVTGFNYFLLVYTPPAPPTDPNAEVSEVVEPRGHAVGFFSKEKMSWDDNNLACILIFPPWQRKGLGALLMGISYEISRREGVIGGPEKPISDLGKRGYKRFWGGEVARWILGQEVNGDPSAETVVDVRECSKATWIAPEDCLLVLREMGVVEDVGKGPPRVQKPKSSEENGVAETEEAVPRVRISQQAVREWVATHGISLEKTCDPEGFFNDYAMKRPAEAEETG